MKVFLYDTLGEAEDQNDVFGGVWNMRWGCPAEITKGSRKGKYWLPWAQELEPHASDPLVEEVPDEDLHEE
jgi:hypothetical protein